MSSVTDPPSETISGSHKSETNQGREKTEKLEQLKTIGRELTMGSQGRFGQSKEFIDLIKSIGESRSKAEEDRILVREIETLKRRISEPNNPKLKMKEYIIRLYVEMLEHSALFGYIHALHTNEATLRSRREVRKWSTFSRTWSRWDE